MSGIAPRLTRTDEGTNPDMLTINHTEAEGTMIDGTSRGDGTGEILKAQQWRWSRNLGAWYIPRSRDVAPKIARINATRAALEAAGFNVTVTIQAGVRGMAESEADRAQRQADRVDALDAKVERKTAEEDAADRRAHELANRYPMGQPILVGHHSEGRHRRDLARTQAASTAAVEAYRETQRAKARADAARSTTDSRYNPGRIARRIDTLEADLRRAQRARDGVTQSLRTNEAGKLELGNFPATGDYRAELDDSIERLTTQITYWKDVREAQEADGKKLYTRADIKPGYHVQVCGRWWKVKRVNAKSVSCETEYSWTDTVKYDSISSARNPETGDVIAPGSAAA